MCTAGRAASRGLEDKHVARLEVHSCVADEELGRVAELEEHEPAADAPSTWHVAVERAPRLIEECCGLEVRPVE